MRHKTELTFRERQVLALIAMGYSREGAGRRLYLSVDTIKTHMKRISLMYGMPGVAPLLVVEGIRRGDIEIVGKGEVRPIPVADELVRTPSGGLIPTPRTSLAENAHAPLRVNH